MNLSGQTGLAPDLQRLVALFGAIRGLQAAGAAGRPHCPRIHRPANVVRANLDARKETLLHLRKSSHRSRLRPFFELLTPPFPHSPDIRR